MPDERNIPGQENSGPPSGPTEPGHIPEDAVVSEPSSPVTEESQEARSGDGAESREPPALKVEGRSTRSLTFPLRFWTPLVRSRIGSLGK